MAGQDADQKKGNFADSLATHTYEFPPSSKSFWIQYNDGGRIRITNKIVARTEEGDREAEVMKLGQQYTYGRVRISQGRGKQTE